MYTLILVQVLVLLKMTNSVSVNNSKSGSSSIFTNEEYIPNVLHLLSCPGSGIDTKALHELPDPYIHVNPDSSDNFTILLKFIERKPNCPSELVLESRQNLNSSTKVHSLYTNGWLSRNLKSGDAESIPPDQYCVQSLEANDEFIVRYCTVCDTHLCLPKCCLANEVCDLGISERRCECRSSGSKTWTIGNSHGNWSPEVTHSFFHRDCIREPHGIIFTLNRNSSNLKSRRMNTFRILSDGSVQYFQDLKKFWLTLDEGTYCVDGAARSNGGGLVEFSGDNSDMVLEMCRYSKQNELESRDYVLFRILVPFAIVFIVLTIVIFILTWSTHNVHGHTTFFYLLTLFVLYTLVVFSNVPSVAHPRDHPDMCTFIAGAIHFFYLSSMCFLTSISIDVWLTFTRMLTSTVKPRGRRRFALFCLFAFGYPTAQVSTCAILHSVYKDDAPSILPQYGVVVCNMSNNDGITYFLFLPISILLFVNVILFIATIIAMNRYKRSIRDAFRGTSNCSSTGVDQSYGTYYFSDSLKFGIYARLFFIMGICWITQIVSWFVLKKFYDDDEDSPESVEILLAIGDAITVLQAVVIFYIFVCKKTVFVNLWNLQPWMRPVLSMCVTGGCCATPPEAVSSRKISNPTCVRRSLNLRTKDSLDNDRLRNSKDSTLSICQPLPKRQTKNSELRIASSSSDETYVPDDAGGGSKQNGEQKVAISRTFETSM